MENVTSEHGLQHGRLDIQNALGEEQGGLSELDAKWRAERLCKILDLLKTLDSAVRHYIGLLDLLMDGWVS